MLALSRRRKQNIVIKSTASQFFDTRRQLA
jgi:hypothetical protein